MKLQAILSCFVVGAICSFCFAQSEVKTDANLVRVKQAWSAQLQAIERIQMEWNVDLIIDGVPLPARWVGRELREGGKKYRAALRLDTGDGITLAGYAGEAAYDGTVSTLRWSIPDAPMQLAGTPELFDRAGTGNYLDFIGTHAVILGIQTPVVNGTSRDVKSISTSVQSEHLILVEVTLGSGTKVQTVFDLGRGGWPIESKQLKPDGSVTYTVTIGEFAKLESHGNQIWFPLSYEYAQSLPRPDHSLQHQITRYTAKKDFVAINEHATWEAPFRLEPAPGEVLWDKRLPREHAANHTAPANATGSRGWSFQELDRINALASAQVRPARSGGDASSGNSSAVSEPTRWIWLAPIGAVVVAAALFLVLRSRRTAR